MKNLICNNAYGVLGLSPDSSQKEILKRVKDIDKVLSIEEVPTYNYDFNFYNKLRNKESVKQAFQDISNPQSKILHYFFSLYFTSNNEVEGIGGVYKDAAIAYLLNIYEKKKVKSLIFKKNIAIALIINLFLSKSNINNIFLEKIILIWKELLDNSKTLLDFKKMYLLDDEVGISENTFNGIEEKIKDELINIFSDISNLYSDNSILAKFISIFGLKDTNIMISQVEDIYKNIDENINVLKSMKISEDGIFDNNEKATLQKCLEIFQNEFNKLKELDLYNNERAIILRDSVATTIRLQILDLYNNLEEDETASKLMDFAVYISGTSGLKDKLKSEQIHILQNIKGKKLLKPIFEVIDEMSKQKSDISINQINEKCSDIVKMLDGFRYVKDFPYTEEQQIRDLVALRLKALAVKLHNDYHQFKEAQGLIWCAYNIAGTQKVKDLCHKDLVVINQTVENHTGLAGFLNSGIGGCLLRIIYNIIVFGIFVLICSIIGGW